MIHLDNIADLIVNSFQCSVILGLATYLYTVRYSALLVYLTSLQLPPLIISAIPFSSRTDFSF